MNSLVNKFDALEEVIYSQGLFIQTVSFHPDIDLFLVILNSKVILRQKLSSYKKLQNATLIQLNNYTLIGGGTGIHWPEIDEDLSLKGFLQSELRRFVSGMDNSLAA